MENFSIDYAEITAVKMHLSDAGSRFQSDQIPSTPVSSALGGLVVFTAHGLYTNQINKRRKNVITWHETTASSLSDTSRQNQNNDHSWATVFNTDLNSPL